MIDPRKFRECDTCAAKPGTPVLCYACIHNRSLISHLQQPKTVREAFRELISAIKRSSLRIQIFKVYLKGW